MVGLAVGSCTSAAPEASAPAAAVEPPVVLLVGDSNLALASGQITFAMAVPGDGAVGDGYAPVVVSKVSAGIRTRDCAGCNTFDYWEATLNDLDGRVEPDVIVTNLGINDARRPGVPGEVGYSDYATKIDWFMELTGDTPVLWTDLPCAIEPAIFHRGCAEINDALEVAPERWPNLTVVDWSGAASEHPDYIALPGKDVHNGIVGLNAWSSVVMAALHGLR